MPVHSAGVLLHRRSAGSAGTAEVLIGHPGGPFWARRDEGAWSIPKGVCDEGEDPWAAACREFAEETGCRVPDGPRADLGAVRQGGGKILRVYAVRADLDISGFRSNTVTIEWPRGSGRRHEFTELDRVAWMPLAGARAKLLAGQRVFLDRLVAQSA